MTEEQNWAISILEDGFGRVRESVERVVFGLSPARLVEQPSPETNSVGWILWHLTRITDDHFAALAHTLGGAEAPAGRDFSMPPGQLWASWRTRIGTPYPEATTGYGHSPEEVAAFPRIEPQLLGDYQDAVHKRAVEILHGISAEDLGKIVDRRWDPPVTAAVRLVSILNDATQHVGQAAYVKGLLASR